MSNNSEGIILNILIIIVTVYICRSCGTEVPIVSGVNIEGITCPVCDSDSFDKKGLLKTGIFINIIIL